MSGALETGQRHEGLPGVPAYDNPIDQGFAVGLRNFINVEVKETDHRWHNALALGYINEDENNLGDHIHFMDVSDDAGTRGHLVERSLLETVDPMRDHSLDAAPRGHSRVSMVFAGMTLNRQCASRFLHEFGVPKDTGRHGTSTRC